MLKAYPIAGKKKSADLCQAFINGAPSNAEGAVFWGINSTNIARWNEVRKRGEPWFAGDNSYFDATRGTHFRFTRCGLQHRGRGPTDGMRLARLGIFPKPWITDGARPAVALVLLQSPEFLRDITGVDAGALAETMGKVARLAGLRAVVRAWSSNKPAQAAGFADAVLGARRVITFSSAGAVQAAIEGVPFCALDPHCAAADLSTPPDRLAHNPATPSDAERLRWLGVLADNQWTVAELESGLAWRTANTTKGNHA